MVKISEDSKGFCREEGGWCNASNKDSVEENHNEKILRMKGVGS